MITLIAPSTTGTEYFMTVFFYRGNWVIFQDGFIADGERNNLITRIYDPSYTGDGVELVDGETIFIFNDLQSYIDMCSLSEWDVTDNIPCPDWATGCLI